MNIKCNAEHCVNNKDNKCLLKDIELNFNWDYEGYGCYCSNFKESKEYKRRFYKIIKLKENEFLIIQTNSLESPINYIDDIAEDIKSEYIIDNEIVLTFDRLLACFDARASNRFIKCVYSYSENNLLSDKVLENSDKKCIDPNLLKCSCNYLRDEYKISKESNRRGYLRKEDVKMILKGMNI